METSKTIIKLKQIIAFLKNTNNLGDKKLDIIIAMSKIIDDELLTDNSIANALNENLKASNRILEIDIKFAINKDIKLNEVHEILYLMKIALTLLISKFNIFDYYIYSEVKATLLFYIKSSIEHKFYDSTNVKFGINQLEYHLQNQMFKTIYSIFDKMTYINHFIVQKFELKKVNEEVNYRFINDFVKLSTSLFTSKASSNRFEEYVKKMYKSSAFHYVRKLRNSLEHSFTNPEFKYNIAMEIELVFILVLRTILELVSDFKSDKDIYKLLNKKSLN